MVEVARAKCRQEAAARVYVRKTYFWFGDAYSFELFYFVITVSLSSSTPIILPFGLLFFIIRHCVATYNLGQSRDFTFTNIGTRFHLSAITYVVASTVILQFYNALFLNLRKNKDNTALSFCAAFVSLMSGVLVLIQNSTKWKLPFQIVKPRRVLLSKPVKQNYVNPFLQKHSAWLDTEVRKKYQRDVATQVDIYTEIGTEQE